MASTRNLSVNDGLSEFLNQAWATNSTPQGEGAELWRQSNPNWAATNPMAWVNGIQGLDLNRGIRDPANLAAANAYGPQNVAEKMGWQYDPATQQFTVPQSEDNFFGDFKEFAEVPMIFGGLMAGAGALNGMLGGAASGAGGAGTAADWWTGMPSGTTEASFGGMSGGGGGLSANLLGEYASPTNFLSSGADAAPSIGNEANWWDAVPQGTAEAAAGGVGSAAASGGGGIMDIIKNALSGISGGDLLRTGGTILGAGLNYLGSQNAAEAQQQGARDQQGLLRYMYDQNRTDLEPWRNAGKDALENLVNLTTPGKQLDTAMLDPGYAFRQSEGEKGINRAAAARGLWDSGRTYKALDRFNQDYATGEFGNVFNRNAALAGIGQTAVGQGVQAGQNYAQNAGESMLQGANARASGYVGGANAISGGLSSLINNFQEQALLDRILGRR